MRANPDWGSLIRLVYRVCPGMTLERIGNMTLPEFLNWVRAAKMIEEGSGHERR